MPYGLIDYDTLKNIARAIRYKANTNRDYRPRDMAQAINTIKSGGGVDEPFIPRFQILKHIIAIIVSINFITLLILSLLINSQIIKIQLLGFLALNLGPGLVLQM